MSPQHGGIREIQGHTLIADRNHGKAVQHLLPSPVSSWVLGQVPSTLRGGQEDLQRAWLGCMPRKAHVSPVSMSVLAGRAEEGTDVEFFACVSRGVTSQDASLDIGRR